MLMHIKSLLISWQANCDCQPLVYQDLLNLVKYICSYCCKGATFTEEFITIYRQLLDCSDLNTSVKNIVQRLLMKIVGIVDVPAAAADFINTGGQLYHSSHSMHRVGLSGYRPLKNTIDDNENITNRTQLDKFLSVERRNIDPEISLYDWARKCSCKKDCGSDHIPVFTRAHIKPIWPLSENFCKSQLMIYILKGHGMHLMT